MFSITETSPGSFGVRRQLPWDSKQQQPRIHQLQALLEGSWVVLHGVYVGDFLL